MAAAAKGHADAGFAASKLATAKFFAAKMLPEVYSLCDSTEAGDESVMGLKAENF